MKIALVIERMFPQRGGRERSVGQIAAELARRGHDVTVLCQEGQAAGDGEVSQRDSSPSEPRVKVVPLGRPKTLLRALALPRFGSAVRRFIEDNPFDIVHATLPVPCTIYQPRGGTVAGNLQAKRRRSPLVGNLERLLIQLNLSGRSVALECEKAILERKEIACLCVSHVVADELKRFHNRTENVRVVYNGVDVPEVSPDRRRQWRQQWRAKWQAEEGTTVFLSVTENFRVKGVAQAVEALARLVRSGKTDVRLVVVGGDRPGRYVRQALRAGVGGLVRFEGHVPDVFPLYSAADAVVLLSWQDACSRVVLEALRWGVPSLTTRCNGASELLAGAGLTIDSPRALDSAAAALAELTDPARRQELSRACLARSHMASLKRQVNELEQVYAGIRGRTTNG